MQNDLYSWHVQHYKNQEIAISHVVFSLSSIITACRYISCMVIYKYIFICFIFVDTNVVYYDMLSDYNNIFFCYILENWCWNEKKILTKKKLISRIEAFLIEVLCTNKIPFNEILRNSFRMPLIWNNQISI